MLNQRAQILQIAAVCIMCLVLTGGAQGAVFEPSDAFPVAGRLYVAKGPIIYMMGTFATEMVSMSLSCSCDNSIYPSTLSPGTYEFDSFFDAFCEMIIEDDLPTIVHLTGPVVIKFVIPDPPPEGRTGTFDTEIVSMSLSGEVGRYSIIVICSPSPGQTQVTDLGDGTFQVDSFFDVFTELSVDGGESFTPADGSTRMVLTPARLGQFEVVVGGNSRSWNDLDESQSGGDGWADPTDPTGRQWFEYPQDDPLVDDQGNVEDWPRWWNQWYYNDPYDRDRKKVISVFFDYRRADSTIGSNGYAVVTVNWSTTDWSLNPPAGTDPSQQPPLEDFDPANPSVAWVGRMQVYTFPLNEANPEGTFDLRNYPLPIPYNPEWVSIDVRGYNFKVSNGKLKHECVVDPDLPPETPDIIIEQLNWEGLLSSTPYSTWGRFKADYNLAPGVYYVNMALGGAAASQWVVHNLSIETPGGDQTLMTYFDLGVTDGTNVASVNYGYSITPGPINVPPLPVDTAWVPDLDFQLGSEDGQDLGSPSPPEKNTSNSVVDSANSGVLADKDKFVNQPQGANQCAPGAISNSLKYLQATGKIPALIPTSIGAVGTVVGTTATGTPSSWYKKKATHYKDHVNTRWIEAPLTLAKIQELVKELKAGQDIEVDLKGHVECLGGIRLKADGTVDLDLYDDNQTDNVSDPMHTSPLMVDADGTQYVDGMELERFVIECPKDPGPITTCSPYASLDTVGEFGEAIAGTECGHLKPMLQVHGEHYMNLWQGQAPPGVEVEIENPDDPYPQAEFMEAQPLEPYPGDPDNPEWPDDGGVIMIWGGDPGQTILQPGNYASALRFTYGQDPDLSNSIITVVVTAPQFSFIPPYNAITQVSLGLEMPPVGSGIIRSWYWNCGNTGIEPIQWGVPTTLTIDTSITGTAAATPTATNYMNVGGFNITNVLSILVDENATWVGPPTPSPAPGGQMVFMWNYWHWLMISPKTTLTKAELTKHSQGPIIIDEEINNDPDVPLFWGWDEKSDYHMGPIAADDWECKDNRPVTDFHWWGSFPGWKQPYPPCHPKAFHIGIWTDTPAVANDPESYSHPRKLIWEHICDNYVWNFAGYDRDPRQFDDGTANGVAGGGIPADDPSLEPDDACFQYNQLLDQDDWFYQEPMDDGTPRIYWLSIAPIWDYDCEHEWGWKTRPKFFMDNAVSIRAVSDTSGVTTWPPVLGSLWNAGIPLQIPLYWGPGSHADAISWDLAFEISTNEPSYEDDPIPGDITGPVGIPDGSVNIWDLALMASNWEVRAVGLP